MYVEGDPVGILPRSLAAENYIAWCCLLDRMRLAVLVQYRRVTDERRDRQTDGPTTTAYTALA